MPSPVRQQDTSASPCSPYRLRVNTKNNARGYRSISHIRRNVLRGCHLLMAVGLGLTAWPSLLTAEPGRPVMEGVVDAVLCAMQLLAVAGVFAPVRLLPMLVFDVLWKVIWVGAVAIPLAQAGQISEPVAEILFACAWAIPFVFIIPWRAIVGEFTSEKEQWRGHSLRRAP